MPYETSNCRFIEPSRLAEPKPWPLTRPEAMAVDAFVARSLAGRRHESWAAPCVSTLCSGSDAGGECVVYEKAGLADSYGTAMSKGRCLKMFLKR